MAMLWLLTRNGYQSAIRSAATSGRLRCSRSQGRSGNESNAAQRLRDASSQTQSLHGVVRTSVRKHTQIRREHNLHPECVTRSW